MHLRRGVHRSTRQLEDAVRQYLKTYNENPRPFTWTKTADEILQLMQILNREHGKTIVMVTHDAQAAEYANRTLHCDKGTLEAREAA